MSSLFQCSSLFRWKLKCPLYEAVLCYVTLTEFWEPTVPALFPLSVRLGSSKTRAKPQHLVSTKEVWGGVTCHLEEPFYGNLNLWLFCTSSVKELFFLHRAPHNGFSLYSLKEPLKEVGQHGFFNICNLLITNIFTWPYFCSYIWHESSSFIQLAQRNSEIQP